MGFNGIEWGFDGIQLKLNGILREFIGVNGISLQNARALTWENGEQNWRCKAYRMEDE